MFKKFIALSHNLIKYVNRILQYKNDLDFQIQLIAFGKQKNKLI